MQTIERLADLITHLPGNLVYYLMTLLLLEAAILFAWWQRRQLPGSRQLAIGLSVVLVLRLISVIFTAFDLPYLDDAVIIPILEQLISFATVAMLVWLVLNWQDGQDLQKDARLLGVSSIVIVAILVVGLLFFVVFLAVPQLRSVWYVLQLVMIAGAMIWLLLRQRAGWGYLFISLLAFAVMAVLVITQLGRNEQAPYLMRYADLVAFPMILVAFFRRLISGYDATSIGAVDPQLLETQEELQTKLTNANTQLDAEKERADQLRSQLQELSEVQTAKLQPNVAELVNLRSDLETALTEKKQLATDLESAISSLQGRTEEVARLRTELNAVKDTQALPTGNVDTDVLEAELQAQTAKVSKLTEELDATKAEMDTLVAQQEQKNVGVAHLTADLDASRIEVETLSTNLDQSRARIGALSSDLDDAQVAIAALTTERDQLRNELRERPTVEQVKTGVLDLQRQIQQLTSERDKTQVELGKLVSAQDALVRERDELLHRERELVAASDEAYQILNQLEGDRDFVAKPQPDSIAEGANTQQIMLATVQDLRKPLEGITAYAERLLAQGAYTNMSESQRRYLENIRSGGERISGMVDDLVRNNDAEKGPLQLDLTLGDPTDTIESAISWAIRHFQERDVALRVDIDPELPMVAFEPSALTQALHNLLNNALLASPDHSEVAFNIHGVDATGAPALAVTVADSGVGLAGDELDVVFTASYKKLASIAGLGEKQAGLRNVKAIIDAHNGHISVDSVPNRGANFHFVIPA